MHWSFFFDSPFMTLSSTWHFAATLLMSIFASTHHQEEISIPLFLFRALWTFLQLKKCLKLKIFGVLLQMLLEESFEVFLEVCLTLPRFDSLFTPYDFF